MSSKIQKYNKFSAWVLVPGFVAGLIATIVLGESGRTDLMLLPLWFEFIGVCMWVIGLFMVMSIDDTTKNREK